MNNTVLTQNLVFLILQFFAEEGLTESAHRLEQESGIYFNMMHFEDKVLNGEWAEVEKYLSRFTRLYENQYSTKIYFEIRKQKYLEALDRKDKHIAIEILRNELKAFEQFDRDLYMQITQLITLSNFRENEMLSSYGDTSSSRAKLMIDLKNLVEANPIFIGKLAFPDFMSGRLKTLVNQSLNWQHHQCRHPSPNPEFRSLITDHVCPSPSPSLSLSPSSPLSPSSQSQSPSLSLSPSPSPSPSPSSPSPYVSHRARAMPNYVPDFEDGTRSNYTLIMPRQITEPDHCLVFTFPDIGNGSDIRVGKLMYTNAQCGLVALTTTGIHKFWNLSDYNGRIIANHVIPGFRQPSDSTLSYEYAVPSLSIKRNIDCYLFTTFATNLQLSSIGIFQGIPTLMRPPPDSTFAVYHPNDLNIILSGTEDGHIYIYNVRMDKVLHILEAHEKKVTGLSFSCMLKLMVSCGADAQLCFWSLITWTKRNSLFLQLPGGEETPQIGDTSVEFHNDQIHFLVSHGMQLAVYDGFTMTLMFQWVPQGILSSPISGEAKYSSDCMMIYAPFRDGSIGIFDSYDLRIMCRIAPSVYMPTPLLEQENESVVLATNPRKPDQFSIGLSDGSVKIIEPKLMGGKWWNYRNSVVRIDI